MLDLETINFTHYFTSLKVKYFGNWVYWGRIHPLFYVLFYCSCLIEMCVGSRMCARSLSAAVSFWRGHWRRMLRPHEGNHMKWKRQATLCSTHAGLSGLGRWTTYWRWGRMLREGEIQLLMHACFTFMYHFSNLDSSHKALYITY